MAISNYGELRDVLSRYMFHNRFLTDYDNCTLLFEDAANRRLRVRQMETSVTLATDALGSAPLPADYLLWRTVWKDGDAWNKMDYVHPAYLDHPVAGQDACSRIFMIENGNFGTRPIEPAGTLYEFHYYAKIPTITGANTNTNWLLTAYPDVYLSGVLTEVAALARNLELAQLYKARRDELLGEIIQLSSLTTGATSSKARVSAEYF